VSRTWALLTCCVRVAAFMMSFGSKMHTFRNMTQSGYTLVQALLGAFDFDALQTAQWFMGCVTPCVA